MSPVLARGVSCPARPYFLLVEDFSSSQAQMVLQRWKSLLFPRFCGSSVLIRTASSRVGLCSAFLARIDQRGWSWTPDRSSHNLAADPNLQPMRRRTHADDPGALIGTARGPATAPHEMRSLVIPTSTEPMDL